MLTYLSNPWEDTFLATIVTSVCQGILEVMGAGRKLVRSRKGREKRKEFVRVEGNRMLGTKHGPVSAFCPQLGPICHQQL